jgi:DNA mismatch repair ATPase MutS
MQIGAYYKLIEEDANYMHEEFGLNYTNTGEDIDVVGFPLHHLKNKKRQLLQKNICFCIVDEVTPVNGRFIREVVFANCDDEVIGITFVGGPIP